MQKLSLGQIIKDKNPALEASLPRFVVAMLERLLCLERIDELLEMGEGMAPLEFIEAIFARLDITYEGMWEEEPRRGRYLFAANHPFGGMDGLMLGHCVGRRFGDVRIGVNDLLMTLAPLSPIFLPINKHGRQSGRTSGIFERTFEGDVPIVTFPAGMCSRSARGGVCDMPWSAGFIKRAVAARRDVVPVYVAGTLSRKFYLLARLRKALGIEQNLEMMLLPSELFAQRGCHFKIVFGSPIAWEILASEPTPVAGTMLVREEMERLSAYC